MTTIRTLADFLEEFAPVRLAEEWDNVGLLVGDHGQAVERVMTCLTITPATAAEAIETQADLIVAHHPLPFRPLKRLTRETTPGRLLLDLIRAGIGVYSPHTAFDSASEGINQQLAEAIKLTDIAPLVPQVNGFLGSGRYGRWDPPIPVAQVAEELKHFLKIDEVSAVGDPYRLVGSAAIACGSGGSFLENAARAGCELLITGEANFHAALEAEALGMAMLLCGHYASERFAVERLAELLAGKFPKLHVWASKQEQDPLKKL